MQGHFRDTGPAKTAAQQRKQQAELLQKLGTGTTIDPQVCLPVVSALLGLLPSSGAARDVAAASQWTTTGILLGHLSTSWAFTLLCSSWIWPPR